MQILIVITYLIVGGICALAAGGIAQKKGYSYGMYAALGFALPVIGLIIAIVMPDKTESKTTTGTADELLKYKQLLDQGVITQDEFDTKKKELLG